jgi:hypothetical protein
MIDDIGAKVKNYQDCIQLIGLQEDIPSLKDHEKLLHLHLDTVQTYARLLTYARLMDTVKKTPFMLMDLEKVYLEIKAAEGRESEGLAKEIQ